MPLICLFVFFEKNKQTKTESHYVTLTVLEFTHHHHGLETHYVEQAGPELTETCLPVPPECWDLRHAPPFLTSSRLFEARSCYIAKAGLELVLRLLRMSRTPSL